MGFFSTKYNVLSTMLKESEAVLQIFMKQEFAGIESAEYEKWRSQVKVDIGRQFLVLKDIHGAVVYDGIKLKSMYEDPLSPHHLDSTWLQQKFEQGVQSMLASNPNKIYYDKYIRGYSHQAGIARLGESLLFELATHYDILAKIGATDRVTTYQATEDGIKITEKFKIIGVYSTEDLPSSSLPKDGPAMAVVSVESVIQPKIMPHGKRAVNKFGQNLFEHKLVRYNVEVPNKYQELMQPLISKLVKPDLERRSHSAPPSGNRSSPLPPIIAQEDIQRPSSAPTKVPSPEAEQEDEQKRKQAL